MGLIDEFFNYIKKNKYLYGLLLSAISVIIIITEGFAFTAIIKNNYTLRMMSYGLFILIYVIYIGGVLGK